MIVIKPLRIRKINNEMARLHKASTNYYNKAETYFEKYHKTNNINILDIAMIYRNLARDKMNEWMILKQERILLEFKPFIFWE